MINKITEFLIYPHTHNAPGVNKDMNGLKNSKSKPIQCPGRKLVGVGVYATVFLLPVYLVKFSIFGIPTNALEILMLAVFASWLIFLKPGSKIFLELGSRKKILLSLSLIFSGLLLSTLINKNYTVGFGIIKSWFVLPLLFSFVVMAAIPGERKKNIFYAYYSSAAAVSFLGLFYFFAGKVTFDGRLEVFFNSPNYLAMYLAPGIIIGAYFWKRIYCESKKIKIFYILSSLSILITFYFTYSYAAWAAVIASIFSVQIIKNKNKITKSRVLAGGAVVLLIIIFLQWNSPKFQNAINLSERSSLASRVMVWKAAGKIISDNPLRGIGPGNFQNKYLEYQKYFPPYLEWAVSHPHNLYLTFWLSGGILGLVGFLALIFFWFREMVKKEKNSLWAISFAIMLYFLIHGLADTTYFKNDLAVIFWINFAIGLSCIICRRRG